MAVIGFVTFFFFLREMGCSLAKCFVVIVVDGFSGCSLESLFVSEMERCTHWQEAGRQGNIQGLDLMNNK